MGLKNNKDQIDQLWNKEAYFQLIEDCQKKGGEEAKFFTNRIGELINHYQPARVLDVGCGEGAVLCDLAKLTSPDVEFFGVDVAAVGITRAEKRGVKNAHFQVYSGDFIPFSDNSFDLCFSTFVFEHLTAPEKVFEEMLRVTKPGGHVVIACPNYGSPFFRSPCNQDNKAILMLRRLVHSFFPRLFFKESFRWRAVTPIVLPDDTHVMDYDTTVEPNLLFFIKHIQQRDQCEIVEVNSFWSQFSYNGNSQLKKVFFAIVVWLATHNFPWLKYYGPFFFVALRKIK